ncbi:hypothetical protein [Vibrio nigripulchritudo]|uniref:hypothetical protein n=1 Tax=Vibrio nigripulchritudo TaxID=28173 RepID=UPI0003B1FC8F|nr:hypothetical protein [Vibrio nigripulchritudo]CCN73272.1 hypothetical protein VIBNISFn118_790021 [Vibrio nigripulchritudo SFn118]
MSTTSQTLSFHTIVEDSNKRIAKIREEKKSAVTTTARNLGFAGFIIVGLFLFGIIALQVISGALALVIAFSAAALLFYSYRYLKMADPMIKRKMRNHTLKKMIEEARTNKIETLTNWVITSEKRLEEARESRDALGGYVNRLDKKVSDSDKNASTYETKLRTLESVKQAYEVVVGNVQKAGEAHKQLKIKVAEYKDMAEFADMAKTALEMANASKGDALDEMLGMEAFAGIEQEFHQALISVENSVSDARIDND